SVAIHGDESRGVSTENDVHQCIADCALCASQWAKQKENEDSPEYSLGIGGCRSRRHVTHNDEQPEGQMHGAKACREEDPSYRSNIHGIASLVCIFLRSAVRASWPMELRTSTGSLFRA